MRTDYDSAKPRDIIQILETHHWAGCVAIVHEEKNFGCVAYVKLPLQGEAYIRLLEKDYVVVGRLKD